MKQQKQQKKHWTKCLSWLSNMQERRKMIEHLNFDVVIVGVGVSGLYAALNLSKERKILMICKENMEDCDSMLAQGGICVMRDENDYDDFFEDLE